MNLSNLFKRNKPAVAPPIAQENPGVEPAPMGTQLPNAEQAIEASEPLTARQDPIMAKACDIEQAVIEVLRTVYDPEIPVNIYELGLVYAIDIDADGKVVVRMTLTSPGCPVAGSLPPEVESKVSQVPGVTSAKVNLVWDPPWDMSQMSEAAKLQLGMF